MKNNLFIFDIDGTLTDSVEMYHVAITKSMISLGILDIDTDYDNYIHHSDSYALRYNYERNFDTSFSSELLDNFENDLVTQMNMLNPVEEIKGAKSLLTAFREKKIPFCFATGSLPKPAIHKLKQCNLWHDELLLSTSKTHESREGFVRDAIERSKVYYGKDQFDTIISIGDGIWDLKTAQNLSLDFIGIGYKNREKLEKQGAKHWFKDIEEFSKNWVQP